MPLALVAMVGSPAEARAHRQTHAAVNMASFMAEECW